jgi:hypothetical protein
VQYLAIGIRCLIGALFLASAISKVSTRGAFGAFVSSVRGMRLLPPGRARPVAIVVVVAEFGVCVLLAVPVAAATVAGFMVAAGLLAVFAIGITVAIGRGARVPCRCFGASTTPLGPRHVARDAGLAAVAVAGAVVALSTGPVHAGGAAVAALAGLLLGGLVLAIDDIVELFLPINSKVSGDTGGFG